MVHPQSIIAGLIFAHLLLLSLFAQTPYGSSDNAILTRLVSTQGALLALWIALGKRNTMPWRACLGLAAIAYVIFARYVLVHDPLFPATPIWQMFFGALALLTMRLFGLRLVHASQPTVTPSGPPQFSLLEIFGWMTATAMILRSLRCLPGAAVPWCLPCDIVTICGVVVVPTFVALTSIALVFGGRWLIGRILYWLRGCGRSGFRDPTDYPTVREPFLVRLCVGKPYCENEE